jgi:N-acetyl-anhydromuramoyl-L-alanine amidase
MRLAVKVDAGGRVSGMRYISSPNHDRRPPGVKIDLLVIHNISLPPGEFGGKAIVQLFTNALDTETHPYYAQLRGLRVSAHFLIRRNGETIQFVPCGKRAWHAGVSTWQGRERCNDFSIGVELEGSDHEPFAAEQYLALAKLTRRLRQSYPIRNIVGHSDIAPQRKTDPGSQFDWSRYRRLLGRNGLSR